MYVQISASGKRRIAARLPIGGERVHTETLGVWVVSRAAEVNSTDKGGSFISKSARSCRSDVSVIQPPECAYANRGCFSVSNRRCRAGDFDIPYDEANPFYFFPEYRPDDRTEVARR
jgi:hypothetical protein